MARGCWGRNRGRLCPEFSGRIRGVGGGGGEELRKPLLQIVLQVAVDVVVVEFVEFGCGWWRRLFIPECGGRRWPKLFSIIVTSPGRALFAVPDLLSLFSFWCYPFELVEWVDCRCISAGVGGSSSSSRRRRSSSSNSSSSCDDGVGCSSSNSSVSSSGSGVGGDVTIIMCDHHM